MSKRTFRNLFHNAKVTLIVRADGTISAATYRRVGNALCGLMDCRCSSSSASGPDMALLGAAQPIYEGGRVIAYRLYEEE